MTNPVKKNPFDFSEWSSLADTDPQAFEVRREQAIESVIQSMPDAKQERMRRLQWRIDQERRLAKSPMAACIRLSNMMWENVLGKNGLLDNLQHLDQHRLRQSTMSSNANILSFPGKDH
jgi:hypothetical protein